MKSRYFSIGIFSQKNDDIFPLFSSPGHADKFKDYLSSKHPNIHFSIK